MGTGVLVEGTYNASESSPTGTTRMLWMTSLMHSCPYLCLDPFSSTACGFHSLFWPTQEGLRGLPVSVPSALCPMTSHVLQPSILARVPAASVPHAMCTTFHTWLLSLLLPPGLLLCGEATLGGAQFPPFPSFVPTTIAW